MILYHYSVDSYKSGEKLINDFKKQYRFEEPFILADVEYRIVAEIPIR